MAPIAEVLEAVVGEEQPDPAVLSLLLNALYALDRLNKPLPLVKAVFELKLLSLIGYEPLLDACAVCGVPEPEDARFQLVDGVLCAPAAAGAGRDSPSGRPGVLAAMRHVVYGDPKRIVSFVLGEDGLRQLARVSERFLTTQLDRGFRTLDFYKDLVFPAPGLGPAAGGTDRRENRQT